MYRFELEKPEILTKYLGQERSSFLEKKSANQVLLLFEDNIPIVDVGLYFAAADVGYIGCPHFLKNDVNKADLRCLYRLAKIYLLQNNVKKIIAPLDRDTWSDYRVKTYTTLSKPFQGEPSDFNGLTDVLKTIRFEKKYIYYSKISDAIDRPEKDLDEVNFRYVSDETLDKDIEQIFNLSVNEFKNNLFYGKANKEDFITKYKGIYHLLKPKIIVAEKDQNIIGFLLGYDGGIENNKKVFIMKTIAVASQYRNKEIGSQLYIRLTNKVKQLGYQKILGALIYSKNVSSKIVDKYNSNIVSEYALYSFEERC